MGGSGGGGSGNDAAAAQLAGIKEQRRQFEENKILFQPYREAGERGLGRYESGINQAPGTPDIQGFNLDLKGLKQTPGYRFALSQGEQQLDRLSGKNRQLTSGNRLTAAQEYGQGLGTQLYNQEYDRGINKLLQQYQLDAGQYNTQQKQLLNLTNIGQSSVAQQAAFGQQTADNVSNLQSNFGQIRSASGGRSGLLGQGGGVGGAVSGATSGGVLGGAITGSSAGPTGTVVGAVVGGIVGLL